MDNMTKELTKLALEKAFTKVQNEYPDTIKLKLEILRQEKELKDLYQYNNLRDYQK